MGLSAGAAAVVVLVLVIVMAVLAVLISPLMQPMAHRAVAAVALVIFRHLTQVRMAELTAGPVVAVVPAVVLMARAVPAAKAFLF